MLNPLLVQLFGREVVDRLEKAGLATDDAVARLGPEELGTRAGLSPDLARRVAALAVEVRGLSAPPSARRGGVTRPRSKKPRARGTRRKSEPAAPNDPVASFEKAAAPAGPADRPADQDADRPVDEESVEAPALQHSEQEIDAFVDEAGLIAWMGFAARTGPRGSLLSSVADGILEPASPKEPTPSASAPTPPGAMTLEGSFWSFGSRPHRGVTVSPTPSDAPQPENPGDAHGGPGSSPSHPVPFHCRRSHDGH